jgi:hypothetical protein
MLLPIDKHDRIRLYWAGTCRKQNHKENLMGDEQAIAKLDKLLADDYQAAFIAIRGQMADSDLRILKAHYESPSYVVTATELASKVGFANFNAANLRYGLLAQKFLDFFQIHLTEYVKINALVYLNNPDNEWEWTLRPQVVKALKKLRNGFW